MKQRFKIFSDESSHYLEKELNKWIAEAEKRYPKFRLRRTQQAQSSIVYHDGLDTRNYGQAVITIYTTLVNYEYDEETM